MSLLTNWHRAKVYPGYGIKRALMFNGVDNYLTRTFQASGDSTTLSVWLTREPTGDIEALFSAGNVAYPGMYFAYRFLVTNELNAYWHDYNIARCDSSTTMPVGGASWIHLYMTSRYLNAYYEFNLAINGTAYTGALNGNTTYNPRVFNSAGMHAIGAYVNPVQFFKGSIAQLCFISNRVDPITDFVQEDSKRPGVFMPKDLTGLNYDGVNSCLLEFDDISSDQALGFDKSGNNNHWDVHNMTVAGNSVTSVPRP